MIADAVFVGDTLFMPDYGSARCDFPKGSAAALYDSVQKLYTLPDDMRMFLCHDYKPEGRDEYICQTDIKLKTKQYPFKSTSFQRIIHKNASRKRCYFGNAKINSAFNSN